jgi:hypothetical protein
MTIIITTNTSASTFFIIYYICIYAYKVPIEIHAFVEEEVRVTYKVVEFVHLSTKEGKW